MAIEDVFTITGRGTVATGRVERGVVKVGDEVEIVGIHDETKKTVVTGVEMFRKLLDEAQAGDNVGLLLRGIARTEIERGQVLCKPGSVTPHTEFMGQVYILTKDEGGRHTPFFDGYRPQFYFRTTDVTGVAHLPEGTEMVMPGDNVERARRAHPADRDGGRPALRHPRGWPHRRLRSCHRRSSSRTCSTRAKRAGLGKPLPGPVSPPLEGGPWFDSAENGVLEYPTAPAPTSVVKRGPEEDPCERW